MPQMPAETGISCTEMVQEMDMAVAVSNVAVGPCGICNASGNGEVDPGSSTSTASGGICMTTNNAVPSERSLAERLASMETKIDDLKEMLQGDMSAVKSQVSDHSKRIATLESRQIWVGGWIAGAAAFGAAFEWFLGKLK